MNQTETPTESLNLARARVALLARFPVLNCDTVNAVPFDVQWLDAFSMGTDEDQEPRAEIVFPDFDALELTDALEYLGERDFVAADEFHLRHRGLDLDDAKELADLDAVALADGWTDAQRARAKELRRERDDTRESWDEMADEIRAAARECAEDSADEFSPMMNYAYPLGRVDDPEAAQAELMVKGGPLVVVMLDGEPVLALAGGGMDFSWEIAWAYLTLGFRVPVHFAGLPRMAGRGDSEGDRVTIAACVESCEIAARWAMGNVEGLAAMLEGAGQ